MLMGLSTGEIDYHGQYFKFDQADHPLAAGPDSRIRRSGIRRRTPSRSPWVAGAGHEHGVLGPPRARFRSHGGDWSSATGPSYAAHAGPTTGRLNGHVADPNFGFSVHIHVAETDAHGARAGAAGVRAFMHNFTYRFVRRGHAESLRRSRQFRPPSWSAGSILVGSPATVREQLGEYLERSGANYVVGCFAFGSLPVEHNPELGRPLCARSHAGAEPRAHRQRQS